jgi:hypothetical protein
MRKTLTSLLSLALIFSFSSNASALQPVPDVPAKTVGVLTVSNVTKMLQSLSVKAEVTSGYDRDLFNHWVDSDKDCFNTRAEVLQLESSVKTTNNSSCTIQTGKWYSPYDNKTLTTASSFDVDHVVALKEAWDSGASGWSSRQRELYANDLGYAGSLIAVSLGSNRSKSDRDVAEWLPTNTSYRCTYVAVWVSVKWRWSLSVDTTEKAAITNAFKSCKDSNIVKPKK